MKKYIKPLALLIAANLFISVITLMGYGEYTIAKACETCVATTYHGKLLMVIGTVMHIGFSILIIKLWHNYYYSIVPTSVKIVKELDFHRECADPSCIRHTYRKSGYCAEHDKT